MLSLQCSCQDRSTRVAARRKLRVLLCTVLGGLLLVQPVQACVQLTTAFTQDGPLAGQGGGRANDYAGWTTNWGETTSSTGTDEFVVSGSRVVIGDTGNNEVRIGRGISFENVTELYGFQTFGAEFTQVVDNHNPYSTSVEFTDDVGVTAAIGIRHEHADPTDNPDEFFATLGNVTVGTLDFGQSGRTVEPNTPYWVTAQLDYNYDANDNERLRLWINPTYQDFADDNPDVEIITDLGPGAAGDRVTLGSEVTLVATTNQPGTTKTWDDLLIGNYFPNMTLPRIDIGTETGNEQLGFEEWNLGTVDASEFSIDLAQVDYGFYTGSAEVVDPITVTVEAIDPNEVLRPINQNVPAGVADDLREDGVEANGGIRLILSNVFADGYTMKSYHHQTILGANPEIEVWVSDDYGIGMVQRDSIMPTTGGDRAVHSFIPFSSGPLGGPSHDVIIEFRPSEPGGLVGLNGFFIVPEPGSLVLALSGLLAFLAFGYRRWRSGIKSR